MRFVYSIMLSVALVLTSCSGYQRLLKKGEPEEKYQKALEYFGKKDYMRSLTLLNDVAPYYRGTENSQNVLIHIARCHAGLKDYDSAIDYYKNYTRSFARGQFIQDARFNIGYCYYLESADARLDQSATNQAIQALQEFIDIYPENERVPEANRLLDELFNKLAYKEMLNARLYYNLGSYRGNNYQSAIIVANNALKKYPTCSSREELLFIILQSKYEEAKMSKEETQRERYEAAIDEYYSYVNEFPEGKYRKQADKILGEVKQILNK